MCVTFLAFGDKCLLRSKYKLIVLNNRDELFDRITSKLSWEDGILAGRDQEAVEKGTWMGVNRGGSVGILLSITEPTEVKKKRGNLPSRGRIVFDFLKSAKSLKEFFQHLVTVAHDFHGFHFVGLKRDTKSGDYELAYTASRYVEEVSAEFPPPGIYGFGNSPKFAQFQKVIHGKQLFTHLLDTFDFDHRSEDELMEELLRIGQDRMVCFPDEQIRLQTASKGDGPLYRALCSLFVRFLPERYGTRSHSILLVDRDDNVTFLERRMKTAPTNIDTAEWETTIERFKIDV